MPYLTGNSVPVTTKCRTVHLPDDPAFLAAFNGAILELTHAYNWEQFETLTPDEMAAAWFDIYDAMDTEVCMEIPIGAVMHWTTGTPPEKWLLCNGDPVLIATYPVLFATIGTTYGLSDGTYFQLPDFRDRSAIMPGFGAITALGQVAGTETETLTIAKIPAHNHNFADPGHIHTLTDPGHIHTLTDPGHAHLQQAGGGAAFRAVGGAGRVGYGAVTTSSLVRETTDSATTGASVASHSTGASVASGATGITHASQGGGGAHNNLHPVIGLNFIIYAGV